MEDEKKGLSFLKHKSVNNDAILWLARTYVQQRQVENGQAVLSLLASDPKLPDDLVGRVAEGKAFAYIGDKNPTAAAEQLAIVVEDDYQPDWIRMRAAFLAGQILQNLGKYAEAAASFERCLDFFPKIEMDFYARKNIAWNTLMAGQDVAEGIQPLKKVLNDGKYVTYHDQVYYVLGNLAAKANKPDDAVKYLTLSTQVPKATKKQKALSFAALGDVLYGLHDYSAAKNAYDSAAKYSGANAKDAPVIAAIQKSKGLSEISQPADVIHDQDSLRELAGLSKKQQLSAVREYLREMEKRIKDSTKNAADGGAGAAPIVEAASDPSETASTWYFSNPANMQQGAAEFKRKWGNRPLVDNWRRAAALPFNSNSGGSGGIEEDNTNTDNTPADGLPTEESLLAKIPNTKEQREQSIRIETKAYIQLAKAYLRQLDDHVQATGTLDTLDARFPNHNQKEEELYLRYQLAIRTNMLDKAQAYSNELLAKFPDSKYATVLRPKKEDPKNMVNGGKTVEQYYEETYNLVVDHKYSDGLAQAENGKKSYDNPAFKKRFEIITAMSYAGLGNYNMADTILKSFVMANPGDSLTDWAKEITTYVGEMRTKGVPSWYTNTPVSESGKAVAAAKPAEPVKPVPPPPPIPKVPVDVPLMYTYMPEEEHYAMVVLNSLDSRTGPLKRAIMSVDSSLSMTDASVLVDMYSPSELVLYVKKFQDEAHAQTYMDTLNARGVFSNYKAEEYKTMLVSAKNHKRLFYEKDLQKYRIYYGTYYKK